MQQKIGLHGLLQGRLEGRHQLMRQIAYESHRIRQDHHRVRSEREPFQGGIQCGEELVCRIDARPGQGVDQGGFAGIRVADQPYHRHRGTLARTTALLALLVDLFQPLLDLADTLADQALVRFQLGFARAAQTDATLLPFQVSPAPDQSGRQVAQLGQLHLQLAFVALRPLREDVEDQTSPVQDPHLESLFEVPLLAGRQGIVEQHQLGFLLGNALRQLLELALADIGPGVGLIALADDGRHGNSPGRTGQLLQFRQRSLVDPRTALDEHSPLPGRRTIKHICRRISRSSPL